MRNVTLHDINLSCEYDKLLRSFPMAKLLCHSVYVKCQIQSDRILISSLFSQNGVIYTLVTQSVGHNAEKLKSLLL